MPCRTVRVRQQQHGCCHLEMFACGLHRVQGSSAHERHLIGSNNRLHACACGRHDARGSQGPGCWCMKGVVCRRSRKGRSLQRAATGQLWTCGCRSALKSDCGQHCLPLRCGVPGFKSSSSHQGSEWRLCRGALSCLAWHWSLSSLLASDPVQVSTTLESLQFFVSDKD